MFGQAVVMAMQPQQVAGNRLSSAIVS